MDLFILIPTVKNQEHWLHSEYLGEVIVRAESAEKARQMATRAYSIAPRSRHERCDSPWSDHTEVACEPYVGLDYSRQGEASILYPPHSH